MRNITIGGILRSWQLQAILATLNFVVSILYFNWISVVGILYCSIIAVVFYLQDVRKNNNNSWQK